MSVVIKQWPMMSTYFTVDFRDGSMGRMGCIILDTNDSFYFYDYALFRELVEQDQEIVLAATAAKVAELNTIRNLTRRLLE